MNLFNPGPLTPPDDPDAFEAGVARAGGERAFGRFGATFRSERDPVEIVQHLPGAAQLLGLAGADWDASRYATAYRYVDDRAGGIEHHNHPARNIVHGFNQPSRSASGAPRPVGMAYLHQIAAANRART